MARISAKASTLFSRSENATGRTPESKRIAAPRERARAKASPSAVPARARFRAAAPRWQPAIRKFPRLYGGNRCTIPVRPAGRRRYRATPRRRCLSSRVLCRRSLLGALRRRPPAQYSVNGIEPVGERSRARLQDERRFDLVQFPVAHRGYGIPAGTGGHLIREIGRARVG